MQPMGVRQAQPFNGAEGDQFDSLKQAGGLAAKLGTPEYKDEQAAILRDIRA